MKNKLFIISGPSGAGKTTLFHLAQKELPHMYKTLSDTTRPPRGVEVNGRDYNFISKEEFAENIAKGYYIEHNFYDGDYYGTSVKETERARKLQLAAMIVDTNGAKNIKSIYPDAISVFIAPPSPDELIRRIKLRNENSPEEIRNRISMAQWEMEQMSSFDFVITNDNLNIAVSELVSIIRGNS